MVVGNASRQNLALPQGNRQRERLQRDERLPQARAPVDPLPAGQELRERSPLGRLDLLAQGCERGAAQSPQDVRIAPLALRAARPKLSAHEPLIALQGTQNGLDVDPEVLVRLGGRERPATLREARDQALQRIRPAFEERLGQPARRHRAKGVAVPTRVLRRDQTLLAADPHRDRPPLVEERLRECCVELTRPQVASEPEHVVQLIRVPGRASKLLLDLLERTRVEQVAQLLLAEQLLQQVAVE